MKTSNLSVQQFNKVRKLIAYAKYINAVSNQDVRTKLVELNAECKENELSQKDLKEFCSFICERIAMEVSSSEDLFIGRVFQHDEDEDEDDEL